MKLSGKVAIVTGAGRGIGRAVALALAKEGARVAIASRTFSELSETLRLLAESSNAIAIPTDVSAAEQVRRLVDRAVEHFGRLDVVINAAAIVGPIGPLWNCDLDQWRDAFNVNLFGTLYVCHAAVPHLIKAGRGKVINFSGGGATAPRANFSAYGASKAAVVRMTETLAEELKPYRIDVNAIAPGLVNTRMLDEIERAGDAGGREAATVAAIRNGTAPGVSPGLAGELAVFLASSESDGLSGRLISAPHDDWRKWNHTRIHELMSRPWYTLRRLDHHTLRQLGELS
jgi:3-oxoacyl-[acyl-carrier protein] reductase